MYSSCCCEQPERVVYHSMVEVFHLIWQLKVIITIGKKYRSGVGHLQWRRNLFTTLVEFSRRGVIATSPHRHGWIQTSGSLKSFLLAADAECVQTDVQVPRAEVAQAVVLVQHVVLARDRRSPCSGSRPRRFGSSHKGLTGKFKAARAMKETSLVTQCIDVTDRCHLLICWFVAICGFWLLLGYVLDRCLMNPSQPRVSVQYLFAQHQEA